MEEELCELKASMGIYMGMGNHEYISGAEECEEFLRVTPVKLLRDSIVTLPCGVQIAGRDDRTNRSRKSLEKLVTECDKAKPIIVLDHQPYNLAEADKAEIDMQFSGHTHRGQVFPLNLLTDRMYEQSHGYRHWSHAHIIVSSGLALWGPPFRIGTKSELVVITLRGIAE
jgi:predicted MPP superfamily phosphohydrolase